MVKIQKVEVNVKPVAVDFTSPDPAMLEKLGLQEFDIKGIADGEFIATLVLEIERMLKGEQRAIDNTGVINGIIINRNLIKAIQDLPPVTDGDGCFTVESDGMRGKSKFTIVISDEVDTMKVASINEHD